MEDTPIEENYIEEESPSELGSLLDQLSSNEDDSFENIEPNHSEEVENILDDIINEDNSSEEEFVEEDVDLEFDIPTEDTSTINEDMPLDNDNDNNNEEEDVIEDIIEDATDEVQVSIEDDDDTEVDYGDETLMNDLLMSLDEELENQNNNQLSEEVIEETFDESQAIEEEPEDEGFYSDEEIEEKRNVASNQKVKNSIVVAGIAVIALLTIAGAAFGINKLLNKGLNKSGVSTSTSNEATDTTPIEKSKSTSIVSDLIGDSETDGEESKDKSSLVSDEEDDSILKTYTGYVIDVKEDSVYLANLTYDKYQYLMYAWNEYAQVDEDSVIVLVDEATGTYKYKNRETKVEEVSNIDYSKGYYDEEGVWYEGESNPYVGGYYDDKKTWHDGEPPKPSTEETKEEPSTEGKVEMSLASAKENGYTVDEADKDVTLSTSANVYAFDYEQYDELKGIIFKKMVISDSSNISIDNLTIGLEATATYIEDSASKTNDLIELKSSSKTSNNTSSDESDITSVGQLDEESEESGYSYSSNVWGNEWDVVVATINDRRMKEAEEAANSETHYNANGQIVLETVERFESVSTPISIGSSNIVWFKISWKTNADTSSVPNAEDVAVEILTPNKSLITAENISNYGRMWIDEATDEINIILRNTATGDYDVVFTKEIGTYLGDVKIKAIPITGLIELANASAVYTNGRLEVIWNAIGVPDDNVIVEVYAKNGNKTVLLYSANSIDDGVHTVDMASIPVSKIKGNTYDIIVRVTDIDVSASKPKTITATYLSDTKTFKNVEIPDNSNKEN